MDGIKPSAVCALINLLERRSVFPVKQRRIDLLKVGEMMPKHQVEDWFYDAGAWELWNSNFGSLAGWSHRWESALPRPSAKSTCTVGGQGLRPDVFVAGLLHLHQYGIDLSVVDAVNALRPTLFKKQYLTQEELRVYWAPKEAGRMSRSHFTVPIESREQLPALPWQFKAVTGYKVSVQNHTSILWVESQPIRQHKTTSLVA